MSSLAPSIGMTSRPLPISDRGCNQNTMAERTGHALTAATTPVRPRYGCYLQVLLQCRLLLHVLAARPARCAAQRKCPCTNPATSATCSYLTAAQLTELHCRYVHCLS